MSGHGQNGTSSSMSFGMSSNPLPFSLRALAYSGALCNGIAQFVAEGPETRSSPALSRSNTMCSCTGRAWRFQRSRQWVRPATLLYVLPFVSLLVTLTMQYAPSSFETSNALLLLR